MISGLLLVVDAAVTLVWQEPVTAVIGDAGKMSAVAGMALSSERYACSPPEVVKRMSLLSPYFSDPP